MFSAGPLGCIYIRIAGDRGSLPQVCTTRFLPQTKAGVSIIDKNVLKLRVILQHAIIKLAIEYYKEFNVYNFGCC